MSQERSPTGAVPDPAAALRSAFHLAVVAGPATGSCLPLRARPALVGRADADLALADALVSRRHLQARVHRGQVQVRDVGSANGTFLAAHRGCGRLPTRWGGAGRGQVRRGDRRPPAPGRGRRLTGRWHDAPPGTRLALGGSVLEVRARPDLSVSSADPATGAWSRPDRWRLVLPLLLCLSLLPLLATSGANPWRWAMLALPIGALVTGMAGSRPNRDGPPDGRGPPSPRSPHLAVTDPAALLLRAAAALAPEPAAEVLRARLPG
ncbi:FHA domain-containing protein, partial [Georgenia yuyongxinii]